MPNFAFLKIEAIRCSKINFRKLSRNGVCLLDEFEKEIKDNPQYTSEFKTLLAYIELYSSGLVLPERKFREIKSAKYKQYEFKSKNLRIYAVSGEGSKIIVTGGYKKNQKKDINQLKSISKELNQYYEKRRIDKQ
jgi:hypothetical protein